MPPPPPPPPNLPAFMSRAQLTLEPGEEAEITYEDRKKAWVERIKYELHTIPLGPSNKSLDLCLTPLQPESNI